MDLSNAAQTPRPTTEIQHICIQIIAILIFAGIFFQLKHLNDNSVYYEIYNAVLFLIGILIMIFFCIKIVNYSIPELQNEFSIYLTIQKHHYFIIVMSGIVTSVHSIFHLCYLFFDFNIVKSMDCKDNEVICGITKIILFLGIYMQIIFFYKLDGVNTPANATFNGVFIFLFLINLIGFMTVFIFEMSFDMSKCNKNGYELNLHTTANNENICATDITIEGIFLNSSTQYFLVSAYVMLSFYWQLNQNPGIENIQERYSMGDLMKSIKCCVHRVERKQYTSQTEDTEQSRFRPGLSDIIPFFRIFQSPSTIIFGLVLGLTIFALQITINIFLANNPSNNNTSNLTNYSSNTTNMYQTRWHYVYIFTNMFDEIAITISIVLAYKTFCSMKKLDFVESSKPLETRGDRFFIIISHCGKIFQNLSGLLQIGNHYNNNFKSLIIVTYGFDDALGILHAAFQTHFILFSLDWTTKLTTELDPSNEQKRQDMAAKLHTRAIICGILNMFTSAVYLYEIEQSYFNIHLSDQDEYRIVNLITKPLQIFYSCFSFVYMFKLAVNFSYTNQWDNSSDYQDDNISDYQDDKYVL